MRKDMMMKLSQTTAYGLHALMYMARHVTQLPETAETIAKAEGIPLRDLAKVLQRLAQAGFIQTVQGDRRGYVFARSPERISLLELFETIEGGPLLEGCPLEHHRCGGTPESCYILRQWAGATAAVRERLAQTSVDAAAWNHPDHRFGVQPKTGDTGDSPQFETKPGPQVPAQTKGPSMTAALGITTASDQPFEIRAVQKRAKKNDLHRRNETPK